MTRCQGLEREGRRRARAEPDEHAIPDELGSRVGRRALERVAVCAGGGGGTHCSTVAATALVRNAIGSKIKWRFIGSFPFAETAPDAAVSPLTTVAPIGKR